MPSGSINRNNPARYLASLFLFPGLFKCIIPLISLDNGVFIGCNGTVHVSGQFWGWFRETRPAQHKTGMGCVELQGKMGNSVQPSILSQFEPPPLGPALTAEPGYSSTTQRFIVCVALAGPNQFIPKSNHVGSRTAALPEAPAWRRATAIRPDPELGMTLGTR